MALPALTAGGVMPPYLPGSSPQVRADMAPYATTMLEIAQTFGNTEPRKDLLRGLINYRDELRNRGIAGSQWLAGSFLEDCERLRARPPSDIDLVTFGYRPTTHEDDPDWMSFVDSNRLVLFHRETVKNSFKCDAFYVDMHLHPEMLVSSSRYWFGLFSHQRDSHTWKGIVSIPLHDDDLAALAELNGGGSYAP